MSVEGTLGTIDDDAIQAGMGPRLPRATACFQDRIGEQPYLGGQVMMQFRIARDGRTKTLRLRESTIGSVAVERCLVRELRDIQFSQPSGGEAEFTYTLTFQGRVAPRVWDPGMVRDEILGQVEQLLSPGSDSPQGSGGSVALVAPEALTVTFYLDQRGTVVSAGMAAEEDIPEAFADRFIENLKQIKFVQPQSAYAKVTYSW